ncbi:DgyrCDS1356 [Dimorphilus gyrociliatus]|uniref:DgyrCDS1356 n=1 Tax=Dimorphilus gyrociliatus TaxID=2664684 RepID=A0A7I8V8W0_9ANNE|nr:DgyrCDS1356 [Dimorphilus gyrociliatus]
MNYNRSPQTMRTPGMEVVVKYIQTDDVELTMVSLERLPKDAVSAMSIKFAGKQSYSGIVIVKDKTIPDDRRPDTIRRFTTFMQQKNQSGDSHREARSIRFWFANNNYNAIEKEDIADNLFDDLLVPENFPKDYLRYILFMAKLLQKYIELDKMELEWRKAKDHEVDEAAYEMSAPRLDSSMNIGAGTSQTSQSGQILHKPPDQLQDRHQSDLLHVTLNQSSFDEDGSSEFSTMKIGPKMILDKKVFVSKKGFEILGLIRQYQVVKVLEDAFPNSVSVEHVAKCCAPVSSDADKYDRNLCKWRIRAKVTMDVLSRKGIIKEIGVKTGKYIRAVEQASAPASSAAAAVAEAEALAAADANSANERGNRNKGSLNRQPSFKARALQIDEFAGETHHVNNIPILPTDEQPTVAVVTLLFEEKMAIDALLSNRKTYVRAKVTGEGQVYTIGKVGRLRVVTTKLSRVSGRGAIVAAGNTITRLLGTFSKLQHTLIIGVGGGVPVHDGSNFPREGDVVVSRRSFDDGPLYTHVSTIDRTEDGEIAYSQRTWKASDPILEDKIKNLDEGLFSLYVEDVLNFFESRRETRFYKPVSAPPPQVFHGLVGASKFLLHDQQYLMDYASKFQLKAMDAGFGAVFESLEGSRHESFLIIRGISDLVNGNKRNEWQQYAAVLAACYARLLLEELQPTQPSPVKKVPKKLFEFDTRQNPSSPTYV